MMKIINFISMIFISSCMYPVADYGVTIQGEILLNNTDKPLCNIKLFGKDPYTKNEFLSFSSKEISSPFKVTLMWGGELEEFYLTLKCNDKLKKTKVFKRTDYVGTYKRPINIGKINMDVEQ